MSESPQPLSERIYRLVGLAQVAGTPEPGPLHTGHWWEAQLVIEGMAPDAEGARREVVLPADHPYVQVLKEASWGRRLIREIGSPAELSWHLELVQ